MIFIHVPKKKKIHDIYTCACMCAFSMLTVHSFTFQYPKHDSNILPAFMPIKAQIKLC